MISWHKVGQHVVCIHTWEGKDIAFTRAAKMWGVWLPKKGEQLIVAKVMPNDHSHVPHVEGPAPSGVLFKFEKHPLAAYEASLFRPIYPQSIADLRKLTSPSPEDIDALRRADEREEANAYVRERYKEPVQ